MRNLVRRFMAFWYHDDIATTQRKMLRYVWRYRTRERKALIERLSRPLRAFYNPSDLGAPMMLGSCRTFSPRIFVAPAGTQFEELKWNDYYIRGETK